MIFLVFIIIPILEITIFITVGSNIGVLNTIAIILITALIGIFLVRRRGLSLLFNARQNKYMLNNVLGLELGVIFWHFLGGLWLYLFLFLLLTR